MKTYAVASQKGGVGKTTVAVNLAAALASGGKRVLVVDLDSQANASAWLGAPPDGAGMWEVFAKGCPLADIVRDSTAPGVQIAPSSLSLVKVERALAGEPGAELALRQAMQDLPRDRWDAAVLDTPPTLGFLCVSALAAANYVIIPTESSYMALGGLQEMLKTADVVRDRLNPELKVMGILVSRFDRRTKHAASMVDYLRQQYGALVFNTLIRQTVRVQEAATFMRPVAVHERRSPAAEDYAALAAEALQRSL